MYGGFFNYQSRIAESWFDRFSFAWNWWRIYARDPHWVPPYYPLFRREMETSANRHLARQDPIFLTIEALPRSPQTGRRGPNAGLAEPGITGGFFEQPVASAAILSDPRRRDGRANLSLLHCVNDPESLERLLSKASDLLIGSRSNSLVGPVGFSPYLDSGLLLDSWDRTPPLHTAYNPPYLPEIAGLLADPLWKSRLYELKIPHGLPADVQSQGRITPLAPSRLGEDLLSLFSGSLSDGEEFPPIDAEEASFLLRWISFWPVKAWLASIDTQPVGFVILGPDLAPRLKRAKGGRNIFWRAWLRWAARSPVRQGRILFGGVLPRWRGRGIGSRLLHHAKTTAREAGWEQVSIGPVREDSAAAGFLKRAGALPCQSYQMYRWEL